MSEPLVFREASVDLAAITANVAALAAHVGTPHVMAVVKANAYGHGAEPVARAALAGGADWLGVADISEALALRDAGIDAPLLAWLHDPAARFDEAVERGISLGISTLGQLDAVTDAATRVGTPARLHLKVDTGLSRNGLAAGDWDTAFTAASALQESGDVIVEGLFSHLSNASPADDAAQREGFETAVRTAARHGVSPELLHLAATASAITQPESRFSMVRLGIGIYGLSPWSDATPEIALVPAMTLRGRVANVRRVKAGTGASYDYQWRAGHDTTLVLVPLGYAEGIPRQASGRAEVWIAGKRHPVVGRIAMDQFIVDVGDAAVGIGDEVIVFGDPATGAPSADDWARAAGTINYEIVTRIGQRVHRRYEA
ncbi:alanine racemase [Leifsonia sp. Leaf264]|uniref:alanine racemase n=1 Tax=Leifsonia sp. Leaf264 TaxID=1736314 RepID=UPI0006F2EB38|nr:alanine racemase [Leifsonia sp. Leaf264]KQO97344.1 alanine racemase [Leifsonia sp. Leaf264]